MNSKWLAIALAAASLSSTARASTWIVDDDGGPGVDFIRIQNAIDAAAPNDTVLVMPGSYNGFVLDKPLRILGQLIDDQPSPGVSVGGFGVVTGISAGRVAVLADLSIFSLRILDSPGTVVGEGLASVQNTLVSGCADVRLRRFATSSESLPIVASTVQLCDSELSGTAGFSLTCPFTGQQAGAGGHAVNLQSGSLFAVRCSLRGGTGGSALCLCFAGGDADAGNGGSGLSIAAGAQARLIGLPGQIVSGGAGGANQCSQGSSGLSGASVKLGLDALLRYSGFSIASVADSGGTIETPTPADPMLNMLEIPHPGANLTFRINGPVGSQVRLMIGSRPAPPMTMPGQHVSIAAQRIFSLGEIPAGGVVGLNLQLAPSATKGTVKFAQARVTYPDGTVMWTNSMPIAVR